MQLTEIAQTPLADLPMAEFKAHLYMGSAFGEEDLQDAVLESFLRAALAAVEARSGKALFLRAFDWELSHWRSGASLVLPLAPVESLTSLELVDAEGGVTPVAPETYHLQPDQRRPVLLPRGAALPVIPAHGHARIRFSAGYGASWSRIPADLAQAVLMLAAHYYEYRHDLTLGPGCMPFGVTSLLDRYRPARLGLSQ